MIQKIFTQMDNWRNLPNYQLKRRADIDAYDDPVSKRFSQSLFEWATVKAGYKK